MPGVNFGLLNPIQQTGQALSGSAPSASAPRTQDPLQDFSSGFLSAYQQGQNIQQNDQQMKVGDQQLQQQEMKTHAMKQEETDIAERRDAAKQGWNGYLDVLKQQDPVAAVDAESKMAELQQKNALARTADAESYNALLSAQAKVWGRTAQGRNPEEKQAIYQIAKKDLPDSVKKTMPEGYSDSSMMAGMTIINYDLADYRSKHPESNASNSGLGKIQDDINKKQTIIQNKKSQGMDTTTDEQQLQQLQQGANKNAAPTESKNSLNANLNKQDALIAKDASDVRYNMGMFKTTVSDAKGALEKVPSAALGPIANLKNLNSADPNVQVLRSSLNALALQAKELYKLGSGQGFTDADRDFLTMIVGNPGQYKGSIKTILNKMDELSDRVITQNWNRENGIRKRSGGDDYKQWLESNPKPGSKEAKAQIGSSSAEKTPSSEMITIKNNKTGETRQVTAEEAKTLGAL